MHWFLIPWGNACLGIHGSIGYLFSINNNVLTWYTPCGESWSKTEEKGDIAYWVDIGFRPCTEEMARAMIEYWKWSWEGAK